MQSALWKLGALLGVIGVGFMVLLKAQNEMTGPVTTPGAFDELAAIDELDELDSQPVESPAGDPHDSSVSLVERNRAEGQVSTSPQPEETAPDRAIADSASQSIDAATDESVNPFADFASPTSIETAEADVPSEPTMEDASGPNPFSALVGSFTSESDTAPAADPAVDDPSEMESEPTLADAAATESGAGEPTIADSFAPAPAEEEPTVSETATAEVALDTVTADGAQVEPADMDSTPRVASIDAFSPFEPAEDTSTSQTTLPAAADDADGTPETSSYEPTSLTALPPVDAGPALMPAPAESDAAELPAQAEPGAIVPAHMELTTDAPTGDEVAQVSGVNPFSTEEPAAGPATPEPHLVFPGANSPTETRSQQPASAPAPAPELTFPESAPPSTGRAWVGDTPSPVQDPRDDRVVHPDGSVEMTILPRSDESDAATTPDASTAGASPAPARPMASQPESPFGSSPSPQETPPARAASAQQPGFPDPGLSFSKGPIQPSAAADADTSGTGNALSPADFVGVGTITPDTPSTPQQAQLTIEKQAPSDAALGQELIYSILVRNIGRSPAKNVVVEDLVPKGTELQGTDPQAKMTPEKKLVWQLGTMTPGSARTIRIKVIPTEAGQIGSVATVSFEAAVASRTVITAPQLRLALNGPQEVRVGEKAPYKFVLTNTGSADASNVYIRNIIPAGFEHPAAQKHNGVTDIEYEVGTLARGESREVELTLLAVAEGQFRNHAILTADGNVNVETHQPVNVITSRLKIHREGPANRVVGSEARFTNTVSNESARPLQGVTIIESLPVGVKFVQASDGGFFDAQQRRVTWQLNSLEPGGVRHLQVSVLAEQAGALESTVTAVDRQGDTAEARSQMKVAGYSSLTVDVANPARAIAVGEEVALRLKVRNGGTAAASKVETRVQIPPHLRFVSARGPVRYAQQGEWIAFEPIDRIDIQGEQTFDIVLAAASESQDARVVVQLTSNELSKPLSEDESVVIYASSP